MGKEMEPHVANALNQFAELLDLCREEILKLTLVEERTYEYAISRVYSKVLLTCCEIYVLLSEGFPEGAFALSRSLYEALVITSTLLEGLKNNDELLIGKFFDASEITTVKIDLDRARWVVSNDPKNTIASKAQKELSDRLQKFKDKYGRKDFREEYWWADASNFGQLAQKSGFSKSPMYIRLSGNVHFNAYDVFTYINPEEPCVLIGETFKGIELPLWYAALCLYCICGLLHGSYPILVSENTLAKVRMCTEQFSSLYRDEINKMIQKPKELNA
ncbi:MAG: hypothetical protein J6J03_00825 [Tyzzerella sp.]|nr:hypothetical protein [Tyzzerella sp.]